MGRGVLGMVCAGSGFRVGTVDSPMGPAQPGHCGHMRGPLEEFHWHPGSVCLSSLYCEPKTPVGKDLMCPLKGLADKRGHMELRSKPWVHHEQ